MKVSSNDSYWTNIANSNMNIWHVQPMKSYLSFTQSYRKVPHCKELVLRKMVFQCDVCLKTFGRQSELNRHKKSIHSNGERFTCSKCDNTFNRKDVYSDHCRKCKILCRYCDLEFDRQRELNQHVNLHHTDNKFMCIKCGKKYTRKCGLYTHRQQCNQTVSQFLLW